MLQWMGGSRRKVTTSRQSTQKRQKQYFEQRRQQQQRQQAGAENFVDGTNLCTHHDNNRSLDILSLLNLSAVVQNYNSTCHSARENLEGGDVALDCSMSKGQPTIQTAKVPPADPTEFREQGYPSSCQLDNAYPKKVLSSTHDIQTKDLATNEERRGKLNSSIELRYQTETKCQKKAPEGQNIESIRSSDRRDKLKTASMQQLSVFDLLGDDGANGNYEENPSSEAHVAFAMEGLGEMGAETPVHSPGQPSRIFSYGSVSPVKAPKHFHFSKKLNSLLSDLEVEAVPMTQNTDLPLYGSSLEPPFFSEGLCNPFSKTENMSTCNKSWRLINNGVKSKNSFAADEMFWDINNGADENWDDAPYFHDGSNPLEDCHISWKNSPSRMAGISADSWNIGIQETPDFAYMDPNVHKISVAEKTKKFNISSCDNRYYNFAAAFTDSELADRCCKQSAKMDHDLRTSSDGMWSPKVRRHCSRSYDTSHPVWPSKLTEDAGDSLSFLSEESCSSSAVRGKAVKRRPSSSVASQKKETYSTDARNPVNKICTGNIYPTKDCEQLDNFFDTEKLYDSRKFTKTCKASIPNPAHISSNFFNKRVRPENNFLFDEGFGSDKMDPGFSPFCQSLETKTRPSPNPNLWNENHFGAYSDPYSSGNMKTTFERSEFGLSPPLEKHPFCQSSNHMYSYESPVFITHGSQLSKPNFCMDTDVDIPKYSSPVAGSWREAKEETIGNGEEDGSEFGATDCEKLELQKDPYIGSNDLSSEDGQPTEGSETRESYGTNNGVRELIPEMGKEIETDSPVHLKEKPSSLKITNKSGKEDDSDGQPSLPHQDRNTGAKGCSLKERILETEGENIALGPSYQVMLESYVLQLLCVQKVLKEASVQDQVKKVL